MDDSGHANDQYRLQHLRRFAAGELAVLERGVKDGRDCEIHQGMGVVVPLGHLGKKSERFGCLAQAQLKEWNKGIIQAHNCMRLLR